ncbi:GntR family transcriptional regulator [Devosia sp. J2-20]|uniref:GntR family transcriptional regulator n=1 Tax=Devosia sp. J2-20 TaxID=3026161 RepID=UPI00249AC3D0|nr:GntR family transcriptional regulator [Devosia sp. J2-20]WDQ99770.1 GntR family transcriptional regulator [Devosia sp. J2-20]
MAVPSAVAGLLRRPARLGDEVYSAIFARIMSLEIAPGTRISVDAVARQLGVSQTPIREALTRLEAEGLVIKTHLIGYSAAPQLSAAQLADLYELRLLLEPFTARRCAEIMPEPVIDHLASLCAEMETLSRSEGLDAYAQFAQLDMAFHDQLAASAGNGLVVEALSRLHTHVHLFRLVFNARATDTALAEHDAIVKAIGARDPDAAEAATRRHIIESRDRFAAR